MNVVIIKAGGIGSRAQQSVPKQFVKINGKPLIVHTIENFEKYDYIDEIIVSITEGFEDLMEVYKAEYDLNKVKVVTGGSSGLITIANAIKNIRDYDDDTVIVIQEANRPIITEDELLEGINKTKENNKIGTSYRLVTEHWCVSIDENNNFHSPTESHLFGVLTHPQYVTKGKANEILSSVDESEYIKHHTLSAVLGIEYHTSKNVNMIKTTEKNVKVTYPEDFDLLKSYIDLKE